MQLIRYTPSLSFSFFLVIMLPFLHASVLYLQQTDTLLQYRKDVLDKVDNFS